MIKGMIGSGCIDKTDPAIHARQRRESQLRDELHDQYGIPWAQIWNKCEARLLDMLHLHQRYNTHRLSSSTVYAVSTDGRIISSG